MRTITFYSYKGGVGRSLLVANTAKYLSTLGKSVFAIDLDLEAPGLHYKFELGADAVRSESCRGVVDILSTFLENGEMPESLSDFAADLKVANGAGAIQIMRAGTAPNGDYWRALSRINWYEILYGERPVGVPFFLELKERIRAEYEPDFLLIDARTGITEMGGIATTVLPDTVVCLGLASNEHLEGLRAVMRGIKQTTDNSDTPVDLLSVISRMASRGDETTELANILKYLNEPVQLGVLGLQLDEVVALHSEPLLDQAEQLLVGGANSPHELPLLRDYLRLFSKIIPAEEIRPHVGQLIQSAVSRLLDDPEGAQSDLEAVTTYCADQEAYRALLKLYRVRKVGIDKLLATASLMWQLAGTKTGVDDLHIEIVQQAYSEQQRAVDSQKKFAEFGEAVWRSTGMSDTKTGLTIVNSYLPERRSKALQLLNDYVSTVDAPHYTMVVRLLDLLVSIRDLQSAKAIIDRFKGSTISPQFDLSWARMTLDTKDPEAILDLFNDEAFRFDAVRVLDSVLAYRLLRCIADEDAPKLLDDALESAIALQDTAQLRQIGEVFQDESRWQTFEKKLVGRLSNDLISEVTDWVRRRMRRNRTSSLRLT
jgi:hypothetical protein